MRAPGISASEAFRRGECALSSRYIATAIREFNTAEALGHDRTQCAGQRWHCWMLLGQFQEAWKESYAIREHGFPDSNAFWDGEPFTGKRVLIRCLHGFGDSIQFLRYAERIRREASRVIVETHPEMVSLVKHVPGIDEVVTWTDTTPLPRQAWDQQIEVTELPFAFGATVSTIPTRMPYVFLEEQALQHSARRLGGTGRCKVGLLWASSMWNPARCIPLVHLLPILENNCDYYSFQRGEPLEELSNLPRSVGIHDTSAHSPDIADTAADLSHMDLLITVDTMAAHLAGALGKNVWTLLPFEADWRWMVNRNDTPWYPTMRLFRQTTRNDWSYPVQSIASELYKLLSR